MNRNFHRKLKVTHWAIMERSTSSCPEQQRWMAACDSYWPWSQIHEKYC